MRRLCVFFLLSFCIAFSQAAPRALSFEAVEALAPDAQAITAFVQDQQGYVWIGTAEGGLFRHDGKRAKSFLTDTSNPKSLPGGRVGALFVDSAGRLWVGTDEGLARYEPETQQFTRFLPPPGPENQKIVRRILGDGKEGLWLGTWGGVQHFDPVSATFTVYQHDPAKPDSLARNDINAMVLDDVGGLWVGTWPSGIDHLAPGAKGFRHFRIDSDAQPDPKLNIVRAMHAGRGGRLWIGTDAGIVLWKMRTPWEQRERLETGIGRINYIDEGRNGDVWIATRTGGMLRWDPSTGKMQAFQHRTEDPRSLPSNAINSFLIDRTGTLWIGSLSDGVARANLGAHGFERLVPRDLSQESFKSSNFVRSLAPAAGGKLWVGVDDGLVLLDPGQRVVEKHYRNDPARAGSLSHNTVYSVYQAAQGPLWVGTSVGLNRQDKPDGPFHVVDLKAARPDFINTIAPGKGGVLWLGCANRLLRFDPASGAVQSFAHEANNPDSRSVDGAISVLEDSRGRVWTGEFLRGGGLDMLDPARGKVRHFRHDPARPDSLPSDRVSSLLEDKLGNLWVGTTRGLVRIGPDLRIKRIPHTRQVEALRMDRTGNLWVATVEGLARFDPYSETQSAFTIEDGLTEGFYLNSAAAATDGKLYFGGNQGLTAVNPAIHSSVSRPPQLGISAISLANKVLGDGPLPSGVQVEGSLSNPQSVTLPWHASIIGIDLAALHFAAPKRNRYSHWLEGFDADWVTDNASSVTYTNLAPGTYRFHLQATNNKGMPARSELAFNLTITPPWWATWWFRSLAAVILLAALGAVYRWRVRSLTTHARQLEALVHERTAALEASNLKLATLSSVDPLTGLANRRHFDDTLAREWRRAMRGQEMLAVLLLDIDHFKHYNDHYGAPAGDDALRRVATAMETSVHRASDLAARYGGEEFALIAPGANSANALRMAETLRAAVEALAVTHVKSGFGRLTVSIGVAAMAPQEQLEPQELLRRADQALYRAKQAGRNRALAAPDQTLKLEISTGVIPDLVQ